MTVAAEGEDTEKTGYDSSRNREKKREHRLVLQSMHTCGCKKPHTLDIVICHGNYSLVENFFLEGFAASCYAS